MTNTIDTDPWGIMREYEDAGGIRHRISPSTHEDLLRCMGVDPRSPESPPPAPVQVICAGQALPLSEPAELILEDGTVLRVKRKLPPDLPIGYHDLRSAKNGRGMRLIVSPGECHLPADLQAWGWALQLYALRSRESWGMGDLADLREFARSSACDLGAGFLMLNPIGAVTPTLPQQPSPYFPGSRRYRNPLYLRVEEVPGAASAGIGLDRIARAGRALNRKRRIDRDAVFRLKMQALERIWKRFPGDPRFDRFCAAQGESLRQFATFCVLAQRHQGGWQQWPTRFRRPNSPGVKRFAAEHERQIQFHQWLQWLLDEQLAQAAGELPLMQDLPIGVDPSGADAWSWQEMLAAGVTVGAPPDAFNTQGQNWGLPPFVPHTLRAACYEPFREIIRATLRHAGGLRIDHVMGLFRLFWIPGGASPRDGAYVRYRADELLAVLAIESHRAKAVIVGEDLGTVEPGVRAVLRRNQLLSYRLLWFESNPPETFPRQALAAVTTHDLFTIAGLWSGSDLAAQQKLGLKPNAAGTREILDRLRKAIGLPGSASLDDAIARTHRLLAKAPSCLLAATLDDALAVPERPNMPGTTHQWPNWSLALPQSLEQIRRNPLVRKVADALRRVKS